jgi:hypothetical protein
MEEWVDVIGYSGLYKINKSGDVLSFRRFRPRILSAKTNWHGYVCVILYKGDEKKYCSVHRLVAEVFIGNPHMKPHVNHKDGIKSNNNVDNLEWCTHDENMAHAKAMNLFNRKKVN